MIMETDQFSPAYICEFIFKVYNKTVCIKKDFQSYEDKVILVQEIHSDGQGAEYIFKILKVKKNEEILEKRITVVNCLCQNGFRCSNFLEGKNEKYIQQFETGASSYLCTLYSYIPGVELENATDLRNTSLLLELGAYLGYLHKTFESISVGNLNPDPADPWLMSNFHMLSTDEYLENVKNSSLRVKIVKVIGDAKRLFNTKQHFFKKGLIHGDFHALNIIVDENCAQSSKEHSLCTSFIQSASSYTDTMDGCQLEMLLKHLTLNHNGCIHFSKESLLAKFGLIDYGEIICTYRILEVGRLIADLMVTILMTYYISQSQATESSDVKENPFESENVNKSQDLEDRHFVSDGVGTIAHSWNSHDIKKDIKALCSVGGFILKGYFLANSLSKSEIDALKDSILISLIQYMNLSENSSEEENENADYNAKCCEAAVVIFLELCDNKKKELYSVWIEGLSKI